MGSQHAAHAHSHHAIRSGSGRSEGGGAARQERRGEEQGEQSWGGRERGWGRELRRLGSAQVQLWPRHVWYFGKYNASQTISRKSTAPDGQNKYVDRVFREHPPRHPTAGPSWGHSKVVLGAIGSFLEPFCGHLSPKK
jgi:hypothetical protein